MHIYILYIFVHIIHIYIYIYIYIKLINDNVTKTYRQHLLKRKSTMEQNTLQES